MKSLPHQITPADFLVVGIGFFVILFIYGWNQYLWPLLVTTESDMTTVVIGVARTLPTDNADSRWNLTMATTLLAMLPPVVVVVLLQRWFVRGQFWTRYRSVGMRPWE